MFKTVIEVLSISVLDRLIETREEREFESGVRTKSFAYKDTSGYMPCSVYVLALKITEPEFKRNLKTIHGDISRILVRLGFRHNGLTHSVFKHDDVFYNLSLGNMGICVIKDKVTYITHYNKCWYEREFNTETFYDEMMKHIHEDNIAIFSSRDGVFIYRKPSTFIKCPLLSIRNAEDLYNKWDHKPDFYSGIVEAKEHLGGDVVSKAFALNGIKTLDVLY